MLSTSQSGTRNPKRVSKVRRFDGLIDRARSLTRNSSAFDARGGPIASTGFNYTGRIFACELRWELSAEDASDHSTPILQMLLHKVCWVHVACDLSIY